MFLGHFAMGFGAKALAPRVSLGSLFLAAQFADLLWPTLLLLGWEQVAIRPGITAYTPLDFVHYPYSHSLLLALVWGLVIGLAHWLGRHSLRAALVVGACVVSHWLLDLIAHRPDLPLYPGDAARWGFGLWNSVAATLTVEGLLMVGGVALYLRATRARDRRGHYGLWSLVALLAVIQIANGLDPPPPSVQAIAWAGQAQWLVVAWGYWLDRYRRLSD